MTEQLRALAAPAEDKSLVPALTLGSSQSPAAPVQGMQCLLLASTSTYTNTGYLLILKPHTYT